MSIYDIPPGHPAGSRTHFVHVNRFLGATVPVENPQVDLRANITKWSNERNSFGDYLTSRIVAMYLVTARTAMVPDFVTITRNRTGTTRI